MKIRSSVSKSFAFALLAAVAVPSAAVIALTPVSAYAYSASERYYDREEIEQLTAQIALYPDPLLAQILSAAAYPEEIAAARRYAEGRSDYRDIDRQDWDPSVRAVARYPEVIDFLARDLDWTQALGIAAINQPDDVADAIQRWRLQAYDLGNLRTNTQQVVYVDDGYVRLVPAQQDYFYVPRYDPQVIYVTRYSPSLPFLFFGTRYTYGSWFDKDWDWKNRRYYYSDRSHWNNGRPVFYPQFDRVYVDRNRGWEPDRRRFHPPERPRVPDRFVRTKVPSPPPDFKPGVRRDNHPQQGRPDDRRDQPNGAVKPGVMRPGDRPDNGRDDNNRGPNVRRGDDDKPGDNNRPNLRRGDDDKPGDNNRPNLRRGDDDKPGDNNRPTLRRSDNDDKPGDNKPQIDRGPNQNNGPTTPRRVEQPQPRKVEPSKVEQPRRIEPQKPVRVEQPKPQRVEQPKPQRVEQPKQAPVKVEQPKPQPQKPPPPRKEDDDQQRGGPRR